jgi:preprotein translocase subunit YajC
VGGLFAQGADGNAAVLQLLPLVLVGVVFYVVLFRPEQKRRREHEQLLAGLKRNDQIVMASGIHGRVTAVGDKVLTVEIAPRVQIQIDRTGVQTVEKTAPVEVREKEREKS